MALAKTPAANVNAVKRQRKYWRPSSQVARSAYAKTLECELHALVRITCCGLEGRAPRERRVRPHSTTCFNQSPA